jgi:hypothetical protein
MADSYMAYAMSVIMSRALPDLRDGLKPVHRRILYAMHELNLDPSGPHRKCAKVVGEVLGKYHPHGDQSVYDALVRMAQDFSLREPLIDGHGNFGSIDPDPAAAMRYTECRLSPLARDALLADIGFDTVDFTDNFDASELEPRVLPARVPMLLLNGASGIAVGMATRIPPHNLGELIDAMQAIIDDPEVSDERLLQLLPGPDFPTGGIIMGNAGAKAMYETGQGSVVMRATTVIEALPASRSRSSRQGIVVTELPYGTAKNELLIKIAAMVNAKQLIGISDIRDESSLKGVRVVFEVRASGPGCQRAPRAHPYPPLDGGLCLWSVLFRRAGPSACPLSRRARRRGPPLSTPLHHGACSALLLTCCSGSAPPTLWLFGPPVPDCTLHPFSASPRRRPVGRAQPTVQKDGAAEELCRQLDGGERAWPDARAPDAPPRPHILPGVPCRVRPPPYALFAEQG